jgi:hypothetical protein
MGMCTVVLKQRISDQHWIATVRGGARVFTESGDLFGTLPESTIDLDWTEWTRLKAAQSAEQRRGPD